MTLSEALFPEHLRFAEAGKKLSILELEFLNVISGRHPYLLNLLNRSDAPYEGSDFKSDFVLPLTGNPRWEGVCIELQGGIYQGANQKPSGSKTGEKKSRRGARTGHSSVSGLIRDYAKTIIAQTNNYFFFPIPPNKSNLEAAADFLDEIYLATREYQTQIKLQNRSAAAQNNVNTHTAPSVATITQEITATLANPVAQVVRRRLKMSPLGKETP